MAKWIIHDKWCQRLGISQKASNVVNYVIDDPWKSFGFREFAKRRSEKVVGYDNEPLSRALINISSIHDAGRREKSKGFGLPFQLEFLQQKGDDFVRAWYLHHALDFIDRCIKEKDSVSSIRNAIELDILSRLTKPSAECDEIKRFVLNNFNEILEDCKP